MVTITKSIMARISKFETGVNGEAFIKLYIKNGGDRDIGNHLWNTFKQNNHSIIGVWTFTDLKNSAIIPKMINQWRR